MKVFITGLTGFIGSELAKNLVQEGHEVFGLVRHVIGRDFSSINSIRDKINLITGDVTDYFSIKHCLEKIKPDVVLHLAALSPVRLSFEHPLDYQKSVFLGTVNIAEAIKELFGTDKVRLVVASTAEVYGIQEETPFTENLRLEPSSPYAVAKASMDMYIRMLIRVYDFNAVVIRTSNTFGRKYDPGFFTEYLITQMLRGEEIYIGAPDSVRDYTYVDNHVLGYLLAMRVPGARGNVFNIAGGKGYTNKEWALKIAELIHFPLEKIHFGEYPPGYPYRPLASDQPYLVLNPEKAKKFLGWNEMVSPDEGLKKIIEYWKNKK
jgi:GDP-mannose 4,6-dehydratase